MKIYKKTLTCLLALLMTSVMAQAGKFSTVVLDAGHGGHDKGGSYGKIYEKHLALDTTLRVDYMLRNMGYKTRLTRKSDVFIPLADRAKIANRYRNSIFISVHYNYTRKRSVNGLETFYYTQRSKPLASYVQSGMLKKYRANDRGVKYARYAVLRRSDNPACLVECGFVSNYSERKRCMQGWYRQKMAEGIVTGIVNYQKARSKGYVR